jgi:arylsulfatase A-like enzyme
MRHPFDHVPYILVLLLATALGLSAKSAPNVLFLFTDDQRQDTIHAWGNRDIQTPNIDRLARSGTSFRNAYIMGASSPGVCLPSRASLLTGRTIWNIECQGIWGYEISPKFKTLPEVFRQSGYETFATGKNDPGKAGQFARAYSSADKILFQGMTGSQYRLPLFSFDPDGQYVEQKPVISKGKHSAEVYADACIEFLERQKNSDKPFYAYVAFQTPHDPLNVPEDYLAEYDPEQMKLWPPFYPEHPFDNGMLRIRDEKLEPFPRTKAKLRRRLAAYYALMTYTDAQIGRILHTLDELGLTENTIIVFASDNGLALGSHGLVGKQNIYEHSVKAPLILSGPGIEGGANREQLCYLYDVHPTLLDLAGLETPETVQYKSLLPVLEDADAAHRDHLYFAFMQWQRSVRDERFKLIEYVVDGTRHTQLFDLKKDRFETCNLADADEHQDTIKRLRALLESERIQLNDGKVPYAFSREQGESFWTGYHQTENPKASGDQPSSWSLDK